MEKKKMEKKVLIFLMMFLIPLALAENMTNFEINIASHFYKDGYEFTKYSEDMDYDGISFEIIGINRLPSSRILNITIFEAKPEIFNNSLIQKRDFLRIRQNKTLFETSIIKGKDINTSEFFISLIGVGEDSNVYYDEKTINISFTSNQSNSQSDNQVGQGLILNKIGNSIWEGQPVKGLYLVVIIFFIILFIIWKYQLITYLNKSMEGYRIKSRYKRLYQKPEDE